jgi:hypothetical protein
MERGFTSPRGRARDGSGPPAASPTSTPGAPGERSEAAAASGPGFSGPWTPEAAPSAPVRGPASRASTGCATARTWAAPGTGEGRALGAAVRAEAPAIAVTPAVARPALPPVRVACTGVAGSAPGGPAATAWCATPRPAGGVRALGASPFSARTSTRGGPAAAPRWATPRSAGGVRALGASPFSARTSTRGGPAAAPRWATPRSAGGVRPLGASPFLARTPTRGRAAAAPRRSAVRTTRGLGSLAPIGAARGSAPGRATPSTDRTRSTLVPPFAPGRLGAFAPCAVLSIFPARSSTPRRFAGPSAAPRAPLPAPGSTPTRPAVSGATRREPALTP